MFVCARDDDQLHDGHVGSADTEYHQHAMGIFDEGPRRVHARGHHVY